MATITKKKYLAKVTGAEEDEGPRFLVLELARDYETYYEIRDGFLVDEQASYEGN